MMLGTEMTQNAGDILQDMQNELEARPSLNLSKLDPKTSVLIIMDMINGFANEGPLASPRVQALIPEIVRLTEACKSMGMQIVALADAHPEDSPEFEVYPPHSIKGTSESQIVPEIAAAGGYTLIEKKSTNGFHEPEFQKWHNENPEIRTWIIVGNCTDICVYQFATTIRTYANTHEKPMQVIVPINAVDTYDGGLHVADFHHIVFLYSMISNGIDVISSLE